jgi:hypothetical protein
LDAEVFRELLASYLLPMLPGARLHGPGELSGKFKQKTVAFTSGGSMSVRPSRTARYEFRIVRKGKFLPSEHALVEAFVSAAAEVGGAVGTPFETEVLRALPLRVVARASGGAHQRTLLRVLEQLASWGSDYYEGQPIAASIGVDPAAEGAGLALEELWEEPFAPVISNGLDTLVVVTPRGDVARVQAINPAAMHTFAPYRFRALAEWAQDERVAAALTRAGELLVFQEQRLRFARRAGTWHHFTHDAVLSAIHLPWKVEARTAMYETLLDVSFARSGGCLAVVDRHRRRDVARFVAPQDVITKATSTKARLVRNAVGTRFQQIDRRIRAELLGLDGATVLAHDGALLAVGAIVRIESGSRGGGRLAAAKTLAELGLGVKVSQDGRVAAFAPGGEELFAFG